MNETNLMTGSPVVTEAISAIFKTHLKALEDFSHLGLTAIKDPEEVYRKHFLDSIQFTELNEDLSLKRVLDIGSGGGFPGVPLKAMFPTCEMTLLEANGKKAAFLEDLIGRLGWSGIDVLNERAEHISSSKDLRTKYREQADVVVARAVADLRKLLELAVPLLKTGGKAYFWKSQKAEDEMKQAANSAKLLSVKLDLVPLSDVGNGVRFMIVATKNKPTLEKFPRPYAQIVKQPL